LSQAALTAGRIISYKTAMRRLVRATALLSLLAASLTCGCQAAMRIAHLMVEGEGIAHNLDQLERAGAERDQGRDR
jgi:hypothetical protein